MIGALKELVQIGQKYNLSIDVFVKERTKYGNIPSIIEEGEAYILIH